MDGIAGKALKVAVEAAREAGKILARRQLQGLKISFKDRRGRSIVTNADMEADSLIRRMILKSFPEHSIISEEDKPVPGNDYKWYIDPLDGTTNYSMGTSYYCVSIALAKGSQPVVGVIYSPALDELFTAVHGRGAFLNGSRISTRSTDTLNRALVCVDVAYLESERKKAVEALRKFVFDVKSFRVKGAGALTMCEVAAGRADAYVRMGSTAWDYAAGTLILEEAGGIATDISNVPWQPDSKTVVAAATRDLHSQIIKRIGRKA